MAAGDNERSTANLTWDAVLVCTSWGEPVVNKLSKEYQGLGEVRSLCRVAAYLHELNESTSDPLAASLTLKEGRTIHVVRSASIDKVLCCFIGRDSTSHNPSDALVQGSKLLQEFLDPETESGMTAKRELETLYEKHVAERDAYRFDQSIGSELDNSSTGILKGTSATFRSVLQTFQDCKLLPCLRKPRPWQVCLSPWFLYAVVVTTSRPEEQRVLSFATPDTDIEETCCEVHQRLLAVCETGDLSLVCLEPFKEEWVKLLCEDSTLSRCTHGTEVLVLHFEGFRVIGKLRHDSMKPISEANKFIRKEFSGLIEQMKRKDQQTRQAQALQAS